MYSLLRGDHDNVNNSLAMNPSSTLLYEHLHVTFVHKLSYSSSVVTPEYVIVHDQRDSSVYANYAGELALTEHNCREKIGEIERILCAEGRDPTVYVSPDSTPANLSDLLQARGYRRSYNDAWMFYERRAECELPPHVCIRCVDSPLEMRRFVQCYNRVYSGTDPNEPYGKAPDCWGENLFDSFRNTDPALEVRYYILRDSGEDAAVAISVSNGECAGLYAIGTVPERRRRGLSTWITLNALCALQFRGVREILLLTERESYNERFYRKLGFVTRWYAAGWTRGAARGEPLAI